MHKRRKSKIQLALALIAGEEGSEVTFSVKDDELVMKVG